jgi:hypothetical protein
MMEALQPQLIFAGPFAFAALVSAVFELFKNELPQAKSIWITRLYVLVLAAILGVAGALLGYLEWGKAVALILSSWLIASGLYAVLKNNLGKTSGS